MIKLLAKIDGNAEFLICDFFYFNKNINILMNKGKKFRLNFKKTTTNRQTRYCIKMLVFVLDPYPLVSEMITMFIHRVQPQARVFTAKTFKQLDILITKYESAQFVFIEPNFSNSPSSSAVANIIKRLPKSKIITITDTNYELNESRKSENFENQSQIINKRDDSKKILEHLDQIFNATNKRYSHDLTASNKILFSKLTKRQRQIINFIDQGFSNKDISKQLGISEQTVKVHIHRLFKLLGTNSRLATLHFVKTNG